MNRAMELFTAVPKLHNCAQAVADGFGHPELMDEMKSCGGGRAPGGLCGALHCALCLVPEKERENLKTEFLRKHGAVTCKELKQEPGSPCAECVRSAAELTEKYQAKPIRTGLWGLGRAGMLMHVPELKRFAPQFQVVAGCDILPERGTRFLAEFPGAAFYTDAAEFLSDSAIDMVSIAVRSQEHIAFTRQALEAGKYVFLEKPFGLSEADADALQELHDRYPGKIYLRHNRRFESAFNHIRQIIASGILGDIFEIKLCRHRWQFRRDWQTLLECGGGQLNNWGPHLIDHSLLLLESPLADVWADLKRVASLGTAEDHIKILFRGENGRIVDLEISDGMALPGPVYVVAGTRGTLVSEDESSLKLMYLDSSCTLPPLGADPGTPEIGSGYGREIPVKWVEETIPVKPEPACDMGDIYSRVYASIREGVPFPVKLEQALAVVRTTAKIRDMCRIRNFN